MAENHKGGVMWPRLVANKLPRRPSGSTNFVADFPSSETWLEEPSLDHPAIAMRKYASKMETYKYKLFASTWNVGGIPPSDALNLEDWLDTKNNSHNIYVLGFQEIVPLSAMNVLGPEKNKTSTKWNALIRATLKESIYNSKLHKAADKQ